MLESDDQHDTGREELFQQQAVHTLSTPRCTAVCYQSDVCALPRGFLSAVSSIQGYLDPLRYPHRLRPDRLLRLEWKVD